MWYPANVNNTNPLPVKVLDHNHGRNHWTRESMEQWSSTQSSIYSKMAHDQVDWASLAKQWIAMQQNQADLSGQNETIRKAATNVYQSEPIHHGIQYQSHSGDQDWRRNSPLQLGQEVGPSSQLMRIPFTQNAHPFPQTTSQISSQLPHNNASISSNHGYLAVDSYQYLPYQLHGQSTAQHAIPPPVLTPDPSIIAQQYQGHTYTRYDMHPPPPPPPPPPSLQQPHHFVPNIPPPCILPSPSPTHQSPYNPSISMPSCPLRIRSSLPPSSQPPSPAPPPSHLTRGPRMNMTNNRILQSNRNQPRPSHPFRAQLNKRQQITGENKIDSSPSILFEASRRNHHQDSMTGVRTHEHVPTFCNKFANETQRDFVYRAPDFASGLSSTSESSGIDSNKQRQLPAWIREGLEKMEREKSKKLEKEKEDRDRYEFLKREENDDEDTNQSDKDDDGEAQMKSYYASDDESDDDSEDKITDKKAISSTSFDKKSLQSIDEESGDGEKDRQVMLTVKTMMTEILLEVTDELIQKSVKSFVSQMKNSRATNRTTVTTSIVKSSGLGGLLLDYATDSDASDGHGNDEKQNDDEKTSKTEQLRPSRKKDPSSSEKRLNCDSSKRDEHSSSISRDSKRDSSLSHARKSHRRRSRSRSEERDRHEHHRHKSNSSSRSHHSNLPFDETNRRHYHSRSISKSTDWSKRSTSPERSRSKDSIDSRHSNARSRKHR